MPPLPPLLINLTPVLTLYLLHCLCPTSFPPPKTSSAILLLYTLSTQLLIHRPPSSTLWHMLSPPSLYHLLKTLVLLVIFHILLFTTYTFHSFSQCTTRLKGALRRMYATLAESTSLQTFIAHTASHLKAALKVDPLSPSPPPPPPSTHDKGRTDDLTVNAHTRTASTPTNFTLQKPATQSNTLPENLHEDKQATYVTPSRDFQHLQTSVSAATSFLQRTSLCIQALAQIIFYIPHIHIPILPLLGIIMSLNGQATQPLRFIRIRSVLIISRMIRIFRRTSSYLVSHRDLYPPFLAVFVPHLLFWIILLSIGEMYVLWICVLMVIWLLSWLK